MPPIETDVLVIGAGPAGCAAALTLARNGVRVVLIDREQFPRDKVCGDALIPDALNALRTLSLLETVQGLARNIRHLRVYAPNGAYISLEGHCSCLPRRVFDDVLRTAAAAAGARFLAPYAFKELIDDGCVRGALFHNPRTKEELSIHARVTLLATGAGIDGLRRARAADRLEPSAVAVRAYFRVPPSVEQDFTHLCLSYHSSIAPGYGWIFPGPDQVFNVGVGYFLDAGRKDDMPSTATIWTSFVEGFPPAQRLVSQSRQITPLRGAPLRTGMTGSRLHAPGLLVIGEAASLTYSFSGEGIGKAMASGIIAAELYSEHIGRQLPLTGLGPEYEARLRSEFLDRFNAYKHAQTWLERPLFANFLAWRAARSRFVRAQLEGLFNETVHPRTLFSVTGILKSLVQ